ncbi:uncharacterized protein LOC111359557 [Spodoptera litura]|uniref:Uncharacterized protein LOC111359557 n=1 Tax=Spodoptera litura TaxID=69820 RepID=A0A9J7EM89_SPOLT|nr:uncharacterized protein LOC111359557 [Spodoptera litura]
MNKVNTEQFINLVHEHKCLWDLNDSNYRKRGYQDAAWLKISKEMDIPLYTLKKKWRGLRDTFGIELKKIDSKILSGEATTDTESKWAHYKHMLFLRDIMKKRSISKTSANFLTESIKEEEDTNISSYSDNFQPSPSPCQSTIAFKPLQIEENNLKCFPEITYDSDAQFLMSLLPFLKDIPKHRKLHVRAKLQQVFIDELDVHNSDPIQC